jgi:ABC-2 type transport system permease protein
MTRLVYSELLKLRTTRLWWGLLIGVVIVSVLLGLLQSSIVGLDADGDGTGAPVAGDPATLRSAYTAGIGLAYLFVPALGIMTMAGEYRHQTMSATALSVPVRWRIVVSKLFALLGAGVGYGIATVAASTVTAFVVFRIRDLPTWVEDSGIPRALALAVLAVALWTLIGLGVGTLIRNQVVALLVAIGIAWIVEPLAGVGLRLLDLAVIAKYLPSAATSAVITPAETQGSDIDMSLLPWWGGALVLLAYALVSAGLGAALTLRRDIT